jgi:hypothetical protein
MDKCVAYGEKKIFPRTQRFGLLLPQRRNERRMDKCVAYGEKKNIPENATFRIVAPTETK